MAGWETTPASVRRCSIRRHRRAPVSDQGRQYGAAGTSRRLRRTETAANRASAGPCREAERKEGFLWQDQGYI